MDRIHVTGVSELALEVLDLDRSERFYVNVLGFPVVERWKERGAVWLMAGTTTRIGLWRPGAGLAIANGQGGVHVHYALHIDDSDFDTAVAHLRQSGFEPEVVSFADHGRGRALYIRDPDENLVEFWTWDVRNHLERT